MLGDVLSVIRWKEAHGEILDRAEEDYAGLLAGLLGFALRRLDQADPKLADEVFTAAAAADVVQLRRVLLAPEVSSRLRLAHRGGGDDGELAVFLVRSFEIERAWRSGSAPSGGVRPGEGRLLWSALGDCCFDTARGAWIEQLPVAGLIVDADSPAAVRFDHGLRMKCGMEAYSDPAARGLALSKLWAAVEALDLVDPAISAFVRRFTLVANVVMDREMDGFSSGSMNQYVGRSIFWNAHLTSVDTGTLAEALVHEAIHTLLDMHRARTHWVPSPRQSSADDVIVSPWTGSGLLLESFLQACFVWYGLLHFWRTVGASSAPFSRERVEKGVSMARAGFLKGSLTEHLSRERPGIAPEVLELISDMQADVAKAG